MSAAEERAPVGRVRKPHGLHGELVVEIMCDDPGAMFAPGRRLFADHDEVRVVRARPFKEAMLVTLASVPDRTAAEAWRGRELSVPLSELAPLEEGELRVRELIGMVVRGLEGRRAGGLEGNGAIGVVSDVLQLPHGQLLQVTTPRGIVSVPYVPAIVVNVDVESRTITIDPPEGLLEL
ncbi:MAG TPA: ribosome maturation factor RimM [Gemmatimonadaceae bacterium]|nr:ribosome maturation factor RimM [Gemmatimonadaceae bacterium]